VAPSARRWGFRYSAAQNAAQEPRDPSSNSGGVKPSSKPPFSTGWSDRILCPRAWNSNCRSPRCSTVTSIDSLLVRCMPNSCSRRARINAQARWSRDLIIGSDKPSRRATSAPGASSTFRISYTCFGSFGNSAKAFRSAAFERCIPDSLLARERRTGRTRFRRPAPTVTAWRQGLTRAKVPANAAGDLCKPTSKGATVLQLVQVAPSPQQRVHQNVLCIPVIAAHSHHLAEHCSLMLVD
jgi:hypothetical protein